MLSLQSFMIALPFTVCCANLVCTADIEMHSCNKATYTLDNLDFDAKSSLLCLRFQNMQWLRLVAL